MECLLVRQPDGKLARYSRRLGGFTHSGLSPAAAELVCTRQYRLGVEQAQEALLAAARPGLWAELVADLVGRHGMSRLWAELADMGLDPADRANLVPVLC